MRLHLDETSQCGTHPDPRAARPVLEHTGLRVRPAGELTPAALVNTRLGEVWSRWARMNDGPRHETLRARIDGLLAGWDDAAVAAATERVIARLLRILPPRGRTLDLLLEGLSEQARTAAPESGWRGGCATSRRRGSSTRGPTGQPSSRATGPRPTRLCPASPRWSRPDFIRPPGVTGARSCRSSVHCVWQGPHLPSHRDRMRTALVRPVEAHP